MQRFQSRAPYIAAILLTPAFCLAQTHKPAQPSDSQLLSQVQGVFHDEHAFVGSSILPSVNHGVVTLTGTVRSEAEKSLASADLSSITGIGMVMNNLEIHDNTFHAPAPTPKSAPEPTGPQIVMLQSGAVMPIRLTEEINTKTAKANDSFNGTLAAAVTQNGMTLLPSGTPVVGRIVDAKPAGHFSGSAELAIELVSVRAPDGAAGHDVTALTQQLSSKANGRGANTAEKAGGGAAFGAIVGGLAGGGTGAAIGATSGGVLGLGANAITRGKEIDLKPEQLLQFRTAAPLQLTVMLVDGKQIVPQPASPSSLQPRSTPQE